MSTRLTAPMTGNLARQAKLVLLLTAALVGFLLLLEFLGALLSQGPRDILAENPYEEDTFGIPNGVRLLQYGVLVISVVFAVAALAMALRRRDRRNALRPSVPLAAGLIAAAALLAAGGYLAFTGVLAQEISYREHTVYRSFLQSSGLAVVAAVFLTVVLAGIVSRYLLPLLLAVWLAAAVAFGFSAIGTVDGLYLFERPVLLEPPEDYAELVAEYQRPPPEIDGLPAGELGTLPEQSIAEPPQGPGLDPSTASITALQGHTAEPEPVFWVVGASRTRYLRTATGDVYEKGQWQQLDTAGVQVGMDSLVPAAVAAMIEGLGRERARPFYAGPLGPSAVEPVIAEVENIAVTPYWEAKRFDVGALPISKDLQWVSARATYHPQSGTVSVGEATGPYEWAAWVLRYAHRDLAAASAANAPAYLQLPAGLPERVLTLAEQFKEEPSPYLRAERIRQHLREHLTYRAPEPGQEEAQPADGQDPVDWFLFDLRVGGSANFSSAFAVLARAAGVPARVVGGWAVEPQAEEQVVHTDQAHQWAEIALDGIGWVTFDPTPTDEVASGEAGGTELEELLEELKTNQDPRVREEAARVLGVQGDVAILPELLDAALADNSLAVRVAAEAALLNLDIEELIRALLTEEDPRVRAAAAETLGLLEDPRAVEPLSEALANDEETIVRLATARALERIGGRPAEEALLEAAKSDESGAVRGVSLYGLGALEAGWVAPDVAELLRSYADPVVRVAAARALGRIGEPSGLRPLLDARAGDPEETVRTTAGTALGEWESWELASILSADPDPVARAAAAEILGERQYREAILELGTALTDTDERVRTAALEALNKMGTVTWLENGSAIVTDDSGIVGYVAGTTAEGAAKSPKTAVFNIFGASHTNYLRTAVGDIYDNGRWRSSEDGSRLYRALRGLAQQARIFPSVTAAATYPQEIALSSAEPDRQIPRGIVPISRQLQSAGVAGQFWPHSIVFAIDEPLSGYSWSSIVHRYSQAQLQEAEKWPTHVISPYTSLPEWARRGPVYDLAARITAGQSSPYAQAKAIEQYLRSNYTYAHVDGEQQSAPTDERDPVLRFLFNRREGTSGNFSSAFVFLARSIGLPARVVSGWAISASTESQTVHTDQAHQWAEVAFKGTGWVTFDPTPGGARAEGAWRAPPDGQERLEEALRTLEEAGATIIRLESGGAVITNLGAMRCMAGTTAGSGSRPSRRPVFQLEGAPNAGYLRTAVGDVYMDGRWQQQDPVAIDVSANASVPLAIRSANLRPSDMQLVFWPTSADSRTIRVLPTGSNTLLPFWELPFSPTLELSSVSGVYYPYSATFRTGGLVPEYSWASGTVHHPRERLLAAGPVSGLTYLQIPESMPSRVRDLAAAVAANSSSPYAKAKALEAYLRSHYSYGYAEGPEDAVPPGRDPVDWFLFEHRKGTAGLFSSAFAIMARSVGIPTRIVSGWAISQSSPDQTVYTDQAHQWAEVALDGIGWVTFEPTPPGGAPSRAALQGSRDLDPEGFEEALEGLEGTGAGVTRLENGGAIVNQDGAVAFVGGLTTRQAPPGSTIAPVFRVEGTPNTRYLRGQAGDVYIDGSWKQVDPVSTDVGAGDNIPDTVERERHGWTELPRERLEPSLLVHRNQGGRTDVVRALPAAGHTALPFMTLPVSLGLQTTSVTGAYYPYSATFRVNEPISQYSWTSRKASHSLAAYRSASAVSDRTYLQLPEDLPTRIRDLALAVTSGHSSPYAKAKALESYLATQYPYRFADGPEDDVPPGRDPVDWFLFDHREGTCGVFSTAFVVMARSVGIPARVVSGWAISPSGPSQIVYAGQAHQWAEIALEGVGWVTFEPTPAGEPLEIDPDTGDVAVQDQPPPRAIDTVTEITRSPTDVRRGQPFTVGGTVRTITGYPADGMRVEIYVNETKEHGGTIIGTTTARNGRFQAEAELPESLQLGNYQLLARAVENERYYESWSDPDISVFSGSGIRLTGPSEVPVDVEAVFTGKLSEDTGVGAPDREIQIAVDGVSMEPVVTDSFGNFEFAQTFSEPGPHWVEVQLSDAEFLLDNRARIDFEVTLSTETTVMTPGSVEVGEEFVIAGALQGIRGEALSGKSVTVQIGERLEEVLTDESGAFELTSALDAPGAAAIRAAFAGDGFVLGSQAATSVAVQQTVLLSVEGPSRIGQGQGGVFAGKLTTSDLEPLGQSSLTILDGDGDHVGTIVTEDDGAFEYEHPAFDLTGPNSLTFLFAGGDFIAPNSARTAFAVLAPTSLVVEAPDAVRNGDTFALTGVLTFADGSPVAGATVEVNTGVVQSLVTGADGAFSWEVLGTLDPRAPTDAVETTLDLAVAFPGTDHLAPSAAAAEVVVGIPRIVLEPADPVARGSAVDLRGTVLLGNRPAPGRDLTVDGVVVATSSESGAFTHSYSVDKGASLGTREVVFAAESLDTSAAASLTVKSAVSMIVTPLDKVRPGRLVRLEARLQNDRGESIPWATLRTTAAAEIVTDGTGAALMEVDVADDETITAVPLTFTFDGNERLMPLTYFIGVPVTPAGFNWLLWAGTPGLIALLAAAAYAGQRMKVVDLPEFVRRRLPAGAVPDDAAAALDGEVVEDEAPTETRRSVALEMGFDKRAQDLPNVWGVGEEVTLHGALNDDEGRALAGKPLTVAVGGSDTELVTDEGGAFTLQWTGAEPHDYSMSTAFAGDDDHLPFQASQDFRVVDFREEIVRLYNAFLRWAGAATGSTLDQTTPREVELLIVSRGVPVAQKSLDELISRFEEADYSEHPIERRHYEAMYRAWRTVVGAEETP